MPHPGDAAQPRRAPSTEQISQRLASGALDDVLATIKRTGGCSQPLRLRGHLSAVDPHTGASTPLWSTTGQPGQALAVACGNRRASRCAACADTYRGDTFHLIRSGLVGGDKGVPQAVRSHPRVFATLTAPSFGPVHRGPDASGRSVVCHPRRSGAACYRRHTADDPLIGQPLDAQGYDYDGHVLWNNHAGDLWSRFTVYLRRHLADAAGIGRSEFNDTVRVSYAKVAEFQARGLVHFHAVVRLDAKRPDTVVEHPPVWATTGLLTAAIRSAAAAVVVPVEADSGVRFLSWGAQVDVHSITSGAFTSGALGEEAVAAYIAKYATKSTTDDGTLDRRVFAGAPLGHLGLTDHQRRLIHACWRLSEVPGLEERKLDRWAHTLGFRGHFSTKSRRYSTTLGELRRVRRDFRAGQARAAGHDELLGDLPETAEETTLVVGSFSYAGQGYAHPVDRWLAESHHRSRVYSRRVGREQLAELEEAA
ncbi:replication initiator [Nocardiopsis sp. LOL_012]|uniref:replication initiator n=1 Tax=Nocardiopsis sp. LOL_012 TaxID=3345409 RepID=UPI003A8A0ECD